MTKQNKNFISSPLHISFKAPRCEYCDSALVLMPVSEGSFKSGRETALATLHQQLHWKCSGCGEASTQGLTECRRCHLTMTSECESAPDVRSYADEGMTLVPVNIQGHYCSHCTKCVFCHQPLDAGVPVEDGDDYGLCRVQFEDGRQGERKLYAHLSCARKIACARERRAKAQLANAKLLKLPISRAARLPLPVKAAKTGATRENAGGKLPFWPKNGWKGLFQGPSR